MKRWLKTILPVFALALILLIPGKQAQAGTITSVNATAGTNEFTVSGVAEDGVLSVAIFVYDSTGTNLLQMESVAVDANHAYTDTFTVAKGTYLVKVADYEGGAFSDVNVTVGKTQQEPDGFRAVLADPGATYTYTGSAITPAVIVTNNGEELTEGVDYTVKYSNNIKASTDKSKASIMVTGKGNLTGSISISFEIARKNIGDSDVVAGDIVVASGSKAAPVLIYRGYKLTAKDYTLKDAAKVYTENGTMTVTGEGDFTGTREIAVKVVAKSELKKFKVTVSKDTLIYNGGEQYPSKVTVADSKSKAELTENQDYEIIWPANVTNAGTVKFTVVGRGVYSGSISKSYVIKPLAAASGTMKTSDVASGRYEYCSAGVTLGDDLTVTYASPKAGNVILTEGRDYKVTYSGNKKVSTDKSKAKYTVTFMGNYKGTKAVSGTFTIVSSSLKEAVVTAPDKVYTGKPNTYVSKPFVTIDSVALKTSDYTVKYYKDASMTDEITSKNKLSLADGASEATVYVKVTGKGNYAGEGSVATGSYKVCRIANESGKEVYDLSKAKVTVLDEKGNKTTKAEYTGMEVEPAVKVEYKVGKTYVTLVEGTDYEVTYVNNVNRGKATVIITGTGSKYAGSKTTSFSIVAKKVLNIF